MTLTASKASAIAHIRSAVVAHAAGIGYRTGHADGWWSVFVTPSGHLVFDGYAADSYEQGTTLEQLDWAELGALLQACDAAGHPY